jgi:putative membrane-bound dehydrogenase-like protein
VTLVAFLLASLGSSTGSAAESLGFRVPDNFEVSLYAGDDLAHDLFSMTIDTRGRVVVSGKGYIKTLEDTNLDGAADKAILFSDFPKGGAYGMCFASTNLICVGDDGVWSLTDTDGDGRADGEPELLLKGAMQRGHSANGIVRGPDGWFYLACGNDAGINDSHAFLPGSPVKRVNGGAIVRISPDAKYSEVVAHGLRNPYDLAFNQYGQLFTVDADGERDHHLPWYSPNRLFDIAQGMHHGWTLTGWTHAWNRPAAWPDVAPRLDEIGRGSPTGMLVYRHRVFPERYTEGVFSVCWTYGRVYFFPLERRDSSYTTEREIFLETTGETGFAPVDLEVGPAGDMFVAIGGRGTRGGVFRVRCMDSPRPRDDEKLFRRILTADQPNASWSRSLWEPLTSAFKRADFESAAADLTRNLPVRERIRALEILVDVYGGISPEQASRSVLATEPELSARAIWALSRSWDQQLITKTHQVFADATHHKSPLVKRAAYEAIAALPTHVVQLEPNPDWLGALAHDDERVRAAAVLAARGPGIISFEEVASHQKIPSRHRARVGYLRVFGPEKGPGDFPANANWTEYFLQASADIVQNAPTPQTRLEAARLIQLAVGDVQLTQDKPDVGDGYVASTLDRVDPGFRAKLSAQIAAAFPTGHVGADRDIARTLAMLKAESERLLVRIASRWSDGTGVEDDIHYLLVAAQLPGKRAAYFTTKSARALSLLHHKMNNDRKEPSRFWPVRVADAYLLLQKQDPKLAAALIKGNSFSLPEHSLFTRVMPAEQKLEGIRKLVAKATGPNPFKRRAWTADLVAGLRDLPAAEALPPLRKLWESDAGLRDSVALVIAAHAQPADRSRLIQALSSLQPGVVEQAADAIAGMTGASSPDELVAALKALKPRLLNKKDTAARAALHKLLQVLSGQTIEIKESSKLKQDYQPWVDWFKKTHPEKAKALNQGGVADIADWEKRIVGLGFIGGDASRGKAVFEQRACHACHTGSSRLGPDLKGAAARMSPQDLFLSIVDPNRDVSPAHQTQVVTTKSGETHTGVMIYESPTVKLIQTSADNTARILGEDIVSVAPSAVSLMPAGLLQGLKDQELADLYAYLKALGKK